MTHNITHSIKGRTALITGGAKNLGALLAHDLADHGAKAIAIHYHRAENKKDADAVVADLKKKGVETFVFQGDLNKPENMHKLFQETKAAFGKIDIAINTVGKVLRKPLIETTEAEYDAMSDTNAKSAFFFLKEAGKELADNGTIIMLVTSLLGAFYPLYSPYAGLKAPVEHFVRAAAKEFSARGISVNAIGPGPMETPFFYDGETAESAAYIQTASALSKFTKTGLTDPRDIVPWIRLLAGEGWWMTGQTILVNGGFTTK